jgi:hypothetical protein
MEPKNLLFYLIKRNSDGLYLVDSGTCTFGKFYMGHTASSRTRGDADLLVDRIMKRKGMARDELSVVAVGELDTSTKEDNQCLFHSSVSLPEQ